MLKVASFNVENLFERATALNIDTFAEGKPVLEAYQRVNTLLQKGEYKSPDKQRILDGLRVLGLEKSDTGTFAILRQNRGKLVKRPCQRSDADHCQRAWRVDRLGGAAHRGGRRDRDPQYRPGHPRYRR